MEMGLLPGGYEKKCNELVVKFIGWDIGRIISDKDLKRLSILAYDLLKE